MKDLHLQQLGAHDELQQGVHGASSRLLLAGTAGLLGTHDANREMADMQPRE